MFKKILSITTAVAISLSIKTFASTNILADQQKKVSKAVLKENVIEIFKSKKTIFDKIEEEKKKPIGKILIYHTHTCENYSDGTTIVDAGNDLTDKLIKNGFEVDHITDDFSIDYNNAYSHSRNYLNSIDISQYTLIIDLHRDSADYKIAENLNGTNYAIIKFVFSTSNQNYNAQQNIANKISSNMSDIYAGDFTYEKGLMNFNQDLAENIVLIEDGFNSNTIDEVNNSNSKIAEAIYNAFKK